MLNKNSQQRGQQNRLVWWLFGAVALLVLPFLLYKSQSVDYQYYSQMIGQISQVRELDTQLNEALLVVNQSPSMSYDHVTRESTALFEASEQLWQEIPEELDLMLRKHQLLFQQALDEKRELVENYKSHHAVFKNSSNYFSLIAREVIEDRRVPEEVTRTINDILHAIHRFRINSSNVHLEQVKSLREKLRRELLASGEKDKAVYEVMHIHTGLIFRNALEVSDLLREILKTDLPVQLLKTQQDYTRYHLQQEQEAEYFRLSLFAVSLMLAFAVAITLVKQRRSVRELDQALNELDFQKQALDEHAIVSIADVQGNITYANQKFCDISGYTLEELIGKNHRLVKSDEHPPEFFQEMWRTMAGGRVWQGDIHNISRSGEDYWVHSSIVPFLNEQGKPFRYVSIRTDITKRKKLEEEIAESHKFLTGITENIGECVYVLDDNGTCTFLNREAERQLGWNKEELLGQNIHDRIHYQNGDGSTMPQHECPAHLSIKGGLKYVAEDQFFTRKDGTLFPVSIVSVPLIEGHETLGSVTVFQDISERRENEKTLHQAKEQAEHANCMKSEFLANMSHEIRTPMNGMLGTIELLRDTPLNETQYEYVEAAHRSSEHLLTLINDILDLSKFEAGNIELESIDFDLTEALEDLADLFTANAQGKGLELNWGIDAEVPEWVKGDRVRLWQVLTNLTGNAIKFTERGSVSVKVSLQQAVDNGLELRFEVIDTGIGIPREAQQRIFNAFEQADGSMTRRFGGTGLGLSLSKRLIGLMDGEIGIESEPDAGSTFWFTAKLQRSQVTEQHLNESALHDKRILIVDDVTLNRTILERFTSQWGMLPHCVHSGEVALKALDEALSHDQPYDLILTDHKMPGMNGLVLAGHIRQQPRFANTMLVLHSSEAEKLTHNPEIVDQFDAVLRKPLRRRTVKHQLLRLCGAAVVQPEHELSLAHSEWLNQRVLLVDDNDVNRMIARGMLEKQGITTIETAENGQIALELVKDKHYDLVLMDVQMPVMNGHEATRAIRQHEGDERHTPIVALTAHAFAEDIERCMEAGMDDYLSKPLQQAALQSMMSQWLTKSESVSTLSEPDSVPPQETEQPATAPPVIDDAVITMLKEVLGEDGLKLATETYIEDAPKQVASMREAIESGDWELLLRAAHTLKGSSGNFGAKQLSEVSLQLEQRAKAEHSEGIETLTDEVEMAFNAVRQALQSSLGG